MAKIINPYNIIINQDIPYAKAMMDTDIKYFGDIIIPEDITLLKDNCFYGNSNLKGKLILHNNIISIGAQTCYRCTGLTGIVIGSKIFLIEYNNFYDCHGLLSIVVDSNNKNYDSRNNCNAIIVSRDNMLLLGCINTIIPNTVKSIGNNAFYNVPLVNITIPDSVTSIGTRTFNGCKNLTSIEIPNSVTSIGDNAFNNCSSLASVILGNGLTRINNSLFSGCSKLLNITMGNSVTRIGDSAFYNCSSLVNIIIPNNVTTIGQNAFTNCSGLTNIIIPDNVTNIGFSVFSGCYNLTKITMKPINPPTLANSSAIPDNDTLIIEVPSASLDAYKTATNWSIFADKMVGV